MQWCTQTVPDNPGNRNVEDASDYRITGLVKNHLSGIGFFLLAGKQFDNGLAFALKRLLLAFVVRPAITRTEGISIIGLPGLCERHRDEK